MTALPAVAGAWLAGLLLARLLGSPPLAPVWPLLALLAALLAGARGRSTGRLPSRVTTLVLAACALGCGLACAPAETPPPLRPGMARLVGVAEQTTHGRDGPATVIEVEHGSSLETESQVPRGARVRVRALELPAGARVRALVKLRPRQPFRNPSPHPEWPRPDSVDADARSVVEPEALDVPIANGALTSARQAVREAFSETLTPRAAALAQSLFLGDASVREQDAAAVRDAGLTHVLAVSGLHVTVLAGLLVWLLRRALLALPAISRGLDVRRVACACGIPLALLYAPFAGGAPSAWRAALTTSLAWLVVALGRRPSAGPVTAAAALLLACAEPDDAARPAFLLSVLATGALVTGSRTEGHGARAFLVEALRTTGRATLATAPVVVWCFGTLPPLALVANVVLVPVGSFVLLPLASLHALLAICAPPLCAPSAWLFERATEAFLGGCRTFADGAPGALPPLSVLQGVALAVACVALLAARGLRTRTFVVVACLVTAAAAEVELRRTPAGFLRATFFDVGQGDSALVELPDGARVLIDGGGAVLGGPDPGKYALVPLLAARRIARLDAVVLTHPHPDHYGGLRAVLDAVKVGALWDDGQAEAEDPTGEASRLLAAARSRGVTVLGPESLCGHPRTHGGARVEMLHPCPRHDAADAPNDNSLVLRVSLGRRALLFVGDAEGSAEAQLLARYGGALHADVLKVGHHGSRTSTSEAFLSAVAPTLAVVSCGVQNRFGHPHPEVVARLAAHRVRTLRTDELGGVVVETNGEWLRASTYTGATWSAE